MSILGKFALGDLAEMLRVVRAARAPLLAALVTGFVLAAPPQTREIYRALSEDLVGNAWQLSLLPVLLGVASAALALIARELLRERAVPRGQRLTHKAIPILCAGLIPTGMATGLYIASTDAQVGTPPNDTLVKMPELNSLLDALQGSRMSLVAGAMVCAALTVSLLVPHFGFRSLRVRKFFARRRLRISHAAIFGLGCLVFFSIFSIAGTQFVGPVGLFMLAIVGIGAVAALLTRAGDRRQLPILSTVLFVAVLLSYFDLTDNHVIDLTESDAPRLRRAVDVFEEWYESRADRNFYESQGKPYPVFIVAASGGGLYAAHHAATVLSRIQDRCPNFAQHVFAISGVSGGSLGGALFSSLAKLQVPNGQHVDCLSGALPEGGGRFERQINQFMETDFLSPVLGAALFPDGVQRFLPAVTSRFDRARAFESTLARAWTKLYPEERDNVWTKRFLEHWDIKGAAPALILNSTNVEHGFRVAITPFEIIDMGELGNIVALSNLAEFHRMGEWKTGDSSTARVRDTSLATAVSLSARFPWVMPAGRMKLQAGSARLVDGGYVENSGAETVSDLIKVMARFYDRDNVLKGKLPLIRIHVVTITNLQLLRSQASFSLGETLSPVRTMLSARETRAVVALSHMWRFTELCAVYSECGERVQGSAFILNLYDFDLPLGWLLAPSTRKIVELHSGVAQRAGTYLGGSNIDDSEKFKRLGAYAANNDSAACQVVSVLQGGDGKRCP